MMSEAKTFKVTARCEKCDKVQECLVGADDELEVIKDIARAICHYCGPPSWEILEVEEMKKQDCYEPKAGGDARWN